MPKKAGVGGDAEAASESGAAATAPRSAGSTIAFPSAQDDVQSAAGAGAGAGVGTGGEAISEPVSPISAASPASPASSASPASPKSQPASAGPLPRFQEAAASHTAAAPQPRTPVFAAPRPLSEVSFDDAKPSASTFPGRTAPSFPAADPEQNAPSFSPPKSFSDANFDDLLPADDSRPATQPMPAFPGGAGGMGAAGGLGGAGVQPPAPPMAGVAGMGISISGAGMPATPKPTPAQMSAANQALRIRLLRPDGKPFDGPEITTGPKKTDAPQGPSRTEFDTPRGPKKQAPKVVVKTGPLERAGHALAVLLISAIGIVPLAYLLMQSVHDREDKLAARITVPTKMNVLDGTSEGYLGGMVAVLLVVSVLYWVRLRRRRAR